MKEGLSRVVDGVEQRLCWRFQVHGRSDVTYEPASGQRYKCWLEEGDRSVAVGLMECAGGTAYWVETLEDWATWEIGPDTAFVVSLEAADAQSRSGPIVLSADLGS